jgi:colanic acid biosynthesis protein WcaH
MFEKVVKAIEELKVAMNEEGVDPTKGLPHELFVFATTLIPCPNIDLFITDKKRRLLLTWRDDEFYGAGWHIPGGCLRLKETLDERVQKTALDEIGTKVLYDKNHFITREAMSPEYRSGLDNQLERCHNISMLFFCSLPDEFELNNIELNISEEDKPTRGALRWFDSKPKKLLNAHELLYGDLIDQFFEGELKWKM